MSPFLLLSTLLFPFLLLLLLLHQTKPKPEPNPIPGPHPLPIIGNFHQLGHFTQRTLSALSQIYGPIFRLHLGLVPTLVISSPSLAQQVLKTHDLAFSSRPNLIAFQEYSFHGSDVSLSPYGDSWRYLRRIYMLELLGTKKLPLFVSVSGQEIERMIKSIRMGTTVNITELMVRLTHNIICRVAFGYKMEGDYGERSRFQGIFEEATELSMGFFATDYLPGRVGEWIDWATGRMKRLKTNARELDAVYQEVIDKHLNRGEKMKEGSEEDIVDVLLRLSREGEELTMDHIKGALMNLFSAGTDTAAAIVIWGMTELAKNPVAMKKAQDEVRKVVGKKGKVNENDLPQLQYLKCVVNETLRLHPPLPLLPRETTQQCQINGYEIDAKMRVFVNVWAIGRDKDAWENPEEFNPDRFIGSPIEYNGQDFQFLPFGGGRRICPGMHAGIATVKLALANFLYTFNWELPANTKSEVMDVSEAFGIVTHKRTPLFLVATSK